MVEGKVTVLYKETMAPLQGVTVSLSGAGPGGYEAIGITDANGLAIIPISTPGSYTLMVRDGYRIPSPGYVVVTMESVVAGITVIAEKVPVYPTPIFKVGDVIIYSSGWGTPYGWISHNTWKVDKIEEGYYWLLAWETWGDAPFCPIYGECKIIVESISKVNAEAKLRPDTGALKVLVRNTWPIIPTLYIDDVYKSVTFFESEKVYWTLPIEGIPIGTRKITIKAEGFYDYITTAEVKRGFMTSIDITMTSITVPLPSCSFTIT